MGHGILDGLLVGAMVANVWSAWRFVRRTARLRREYDLLRITLQAQVDQFLADPSHPRWYDDPPGTRIH